MTTVFAKKAEQEAPTAKSDTHYEKLAADPSIPQFPQGSTYTGHMASQAAPAPAVPQPVLTGAGSNAAQDADVLVKNDNSDWVNKKWRPAMGWSYMLTCVTDFVIFPVLWSILQTLQGGQVTSQWQPLTLQGAGLYHIAMGAVLGIAAYGRSKEKIAEKA